MYPTIVELNKASQIALSIARHKATMLKLHAETLETRWFCQILDRLDIDGPMTTEEIKTEFGLSLAPLMIVLKKYIDSKILIKSYNTKRGSIVYVSAAWMLVENHELKRLIRSVQACARSSQA